MTQKTASGFEMRPPSRRALSEVGSDAIAAAIGDVLDEAGRTTQGGGQ